MTPLLISQAYFFYFYNTCLFLKFRNSSDVARRSIFYYIAVWLQSPFATRKYEGYANFQKFLRPLILTKVCVICATNSIETRLSKFLLWTYFQDTFLCQVYLGLFGRKWDSSGNVYEMVFVTKYFKITDTVFKNTPF